jgi:hypothetical protein
VIKPNTREARKRLLKALAALEDPEGYCTQQGYDATNAHACVVGAVTVMVGLALRDLGEPIDPLRPFGTGPYVPTDRRTKGDI